MSEWEIIRIEEDLGPTPAEDRWLISYRVPLEYSPDGTFSYSLPKDSMNKFAAMYEYDVADEGQVNELFDFIMSRPMLKARPLGAGLPAGHPQLVTAEAASRVDSLSDTVNGARLAAHPAHALSTPPADLRAAIKAGVAAMKNGEAPLVVKGAVELAVTGMPVTADSNENPKYVIKRDMLARLDPAAVAKGMAYHQQERSVAMSRMSKDGRGARDAG
jgi:hypothetical protein